MKKILAVLLTVILILQAGMTSVFAENSESNRRVIVIGHVDSLPLDDGTIPCATIIKTYGFSAANIELINEKWIIPRQFTISGKDIPVQDGRYSYYLKIRSDGTLVFDNDLEIYYQGVDGLYKLNYEIDKNDNHVMLVNGTFDNIILASPLLENLKEQYRNYIINNVNEDSYDYELDLWTNDGFVFRNRLQFLFKSTPVSFSTSYDYDLPTDISTVMVVLTKGDDRYVIGPIEFKPIDDAEEKIIEVISENMTRWDVEDISARIREIAIESKDVLPQIKEKAGSVLSPAVNEALDRISETMSENQFELPDFEFNSQIGNDIKNKVDDFIRSWH